MDRKAFLAMIYDELSIHQHLSHLHIISFIEHIPSLTGPWTIMEWAIFGDLERQTDVSLDEITAVARQTLEATRYLHGQGIIHRDIKPKNLLVTQKSPTMIVKLADFGIATREEYSPKEFIGTTLYLAPETSRGPNTKSVDIWSIGVVILKYTVGFGETTPQFGPKNHGDAVEFVEQRLEMAIELPPDYDVLCALAKTMLTRIERPSAHRSLETLEILIQNEEGKRLMRTAEDGKRRRGSHYSSASSFPEEKRPYIDAELYESQQTEVDQDIQHLELEEDHGHEAVDFQG